MPRLLVLADDLTGANETGVQFAKCGIPTFVAPEVDCDMLSRAARYEVIVINTNSRHLDSFMAGKRVHDVVSRGVSVGISHFYKKTDSTLRGNIGRELEALLFASGQRFVAFMPAFPKLNRATANGFQFVAEKLLHETSFANDPLNPITESYVPAIIGRQTSSPVHVVRMSDLNHFKRTQAKAGGIFIFDATTDEELRQVALVLNRQDLLSLTAGSAAFAEYLATYLNFKRVPAKQWEYDGPVLVVNGSVNEISLRQVARAIREDFAVVTLSPESLINNYSGNSEEIVKPIAAVEKLCTQGRSVILRSITNRIDMQHYIKLGQTLDLNPNQLSLRITENLGNLVRMVLDVSSFNVLVVFGGDTLLGISRALRWKGLLPQTEAQTGVTVATIAGEVRSPIVISKAGGFGSENILMEIKNSLMN